MQSLLKFLLIGYVFCIVSCVKAQQQAVPYDALRLELEKIYEKDQSVRSTVPTAQEEMEKFVRVMQQTDSANQKVVLPILEQYGWLPKSKIGEKAAAALFLVIQHAPTSVIKHYLPLLKKSAKQGEASLVDAAMMEDRLLMFQGEKQIYGTQATSMLREDGRMAIWPIEDPAKVNRRRKEAGFESTVEENAARLRADYNPKEVLPKKTQELKK